MDEKLFHAHKDTYNPNNPYPDFVRQAAKRTKVPIELLTRKKYRGKSANGKGDKHHILDKSLFPKKGTPTVSVSKDKHFELQCLLAQATTSQGYLDCEQAVKAECSEIVSGGEHSHKYDRSAVERVAQIRSERYLR